MTMLEIYLKARKGNEQLAKEYKWLVFNMKEHPSLKWATKLRNWSKAHEKDCIIKVVCNGETLLEELPTACSERIINLCKENLNGKR